MTKDEQIKALVDRLSANQAIIKEAAEVITEWFEDEDSRGDIYNDLIAEIKPTEELLNKIEKL